MPTKDPQTTTEPALQAGTAVAMQQAIDAVVWGTPIVSFDAMREAFFRDAGCEFNDIVYFSRPADWKLRITTPNASSLYVLFMFNSGDGPVILEVPPATGAGLFGSILDAWQVPRADIGPHGEDAGQGGRYVLLPPDYKGPAVPDAIPVPVPTFNGYGAFRVIPEDATEEARLRGVALIKKLRAYPLSRVEQPPQQVFVDMAGKLFDGIVHFDERFFASLARMVDEEPAYLRDAEMLGVLSTFGIEHNRLYAPDPAMRQLLGDAARAAHERFVTMISDEGTTYWAGRHWRLPSAVGAKSAFTFVTADGLDREARAMTYFLGCAPPARLGKASVYLSSFVDADGNTLAGEKAYRLHVPAHVPANQFWACTVYATSDAAFMRYAPRVEINSYDTSPVPNDDGSVDLYFGPEPPAGHEANWIYTAPTEGWFAMFRFYGPEEPVFDKSWQLPDIEPYAELH